MEFQLREMRLFKPCLQEITALDTMLISIKPDLALLRIKELVHTRFVNKVKESLTGKILEANFLLTDDQMSDHCV